VMAQQKHIENQWPHITEKKPRGFTDMNDV
jgi:hypothetical protein